MKNIISHKKAPADAGAFSVSINLSTRWQSAKKEVIFCQIEFVGVHGYGRVQFGKKQAIARGIRCFPCVFYLYAPIFDEMSL